MILGKPQNTGRATEHRSHAGRPVGSARPTRSNSGRDDDGNNGEEDEEPVQEDSEVADREVPEADAGETQTETAAAPNGKSLESLVQDKEVGVDVPTATDILEKRIPPICCIGSIWHSYVNGFWRATERDIYRPSALAAAVPEKQTDGFCQQVLSTLESRKQVPRDTLCSFAKLDGPGTVLLCVRNGVLRVTKDEVTLLEHAARYFFTRQIAAAYDPGAQCPLFLRTEKESLPSEQARELLETFGGYTLYPSSSLAVALFCFGPSNSGKSTLWEFGFGKALGDELVTSIALSSVCEGKGYSLPSLQGAALNLAAEAQAGELRESDAFKQLVEGASKEVRGIYGHPFFMRNYQVKFVVLGNHMPRFKSGTDAELRRSRFLNFSKKAMVVDPTLQPRIALERDGIFSQIMVPRLQQLLGNFEMPMGDPKSVKLRLRFAVENAPLEAFVAECCKLGPSRHETKDRLHAAFEHFCERNDVAAGLREKSVFCRKLRDRFPSLESYRPRVARSGQGGTPARGGNRTKHRQRENELRGIQLKEGVNCSPIIKLNQPHDEDR